MPSTTSINKKILKLRREYDQLRGGKESLLVLLDEAELPESVYNSNAIENSTLTLPETEKILLEMQVSRNISIREVNEAQNLARVTIYIREKAKKEDISKEHIHTLHRMLLGNIDETIAGRFRQEGEYVRVGTHIASAPEHIEELVEEILVEYTTVYDRFILDAIARFHLRFEDIHPFNDGNGRIGRVIMNWQLVRLGFPQIIIRDKEKQLYYHAFREYDAQKKTKTMERIVTLAMMESLHKRIAYLKGGTIIPLVQHAKQLHVSVSAMLNAAKRQTIPAFREKGVWKILVG
ncbi:MAG: Fic family protein [Patescibacteria group bacterium]